MGPREGKANLCKKWHFIRGWLLLGNRAGALGYRRNPDFCPAGFVFFSRHKKPETGATPRNTKYGTEGGFLVAGQ